MSRSVRPGPLTGAYYWVPRPIPAGMNWDLVTCHDLGAWDGISHRELWPHVLKGLATAWGKEAQAIGGRLRDHHAGLPRGRIVHPESGYVVIHGDDAPPTDWLDRVRSWFQLTGVEVTSVFTDHEKMLTDDSRAVRAALGFPWPSR